MKVYFKIEKMDYIMSCSLQLGKKNVIFFRNIEIKDIEKIKKS